MTTLECGEVLIHSDAAKFAFRVGQLLESLLLDNAAEAARQSNLSIVDTSDIRSCLTINLIEQLISHLDVRTQDDSRKAA